MFKTFHYKPFRPLLIVSLAQMTNTLKDRRQERSKRCAGAFWAPSASMLDAMHICRNGPGVCAAYEALLQLQTGPTHQPVTAPSAAFPSLPRCVCKAELLICKHAALLSRTDTLARLIASAQDPRHGTRRAGSGAAPLRLAGSSGADWPPDYSCPLVQHSHSIKPCRSHPDCKKAVTTAAGFINCVAALPQQQHRCRRPQRCGDQRARRRCFCCC